jgi:hypothetical protein
MKDIIERAKRRYRITFGKETCSNCKNYRNKKCVYFKCNVYDYFVCDEYNTRDVVMSSQAILNPDRQAELCEIGCQMKKSGLPTSFIVAVVRTAFEYEGVYDLMRLWSEHSGQEEREEIVADLQGVIDDLKIFLSKS